MNLTTDLQASSPPRSLSRTTEQAGRASIVWLQQPAPGTWTRRAACRRFPAFAALFTEARTFEDADVGLTICADCPVQRACLDYGQELRADGVWGGQLLYRGRIRRRWPLSRRAV